MNKWLSLLIVLSFASCSPPAYAQDYQQMLSQTVEIHSEDGLGTGVIIAPNAVLTAAHVVDNKGTISVNRKENDFFIPAKIIIINKDQDWALLTVDTFNIQPVKVDCTVPELGMPINIMGHPLGLPLILGKGYIASGLVTVEQHSGQFIFIDGRINRGNSGGPVFNNKNELVGIMVASMNAAPDDGEQAGDNINIMSPVFLMCDKLKGL